MFILFIPIIVAALATYVAIVLLHPYALSINLTDNPSDRKLHKGSVPLIGGIAMFFGITIAILTFSQDLNDFNYFLVASLILVSIGVLDDHRDISVLFRLLFQTLVAILIISGGGLSILSLGNIVGNGEILLNSWAYFVTVIVIIASINAVNMADGIHGLAAGNSLITFLAIIFLYTGNVSHPSLLIAFLFCAVLPIFLMHNLCIGVPKSKRVFMGDAGSMFIGMSIVCLLIDFSQGESRAFNPVVVLWIFSAPIIEMTSAILRRILSGKSPFKPDILHTHHMLLKLGFKQRDVLLIMLLFSFLMAGIGILGARHEVADWVMFLGFLLVFLAYIFWYRAAKKIIVNINKLSV